MEALSQAKKLINEAQKVLVLVPNNPSPDVLGSALSLSYSLNDANKIVNFYPNKISKKYFSLFPEKIMPEKFLISVRGKEISELYYEKKNQILNIYLSSNAKEIKKDDIIFRPLKEDLLSEENIDLLITIGVESLENLGDFYENNFKLFYQTPILNIDNKNTNNKFGNTNLIFKNLPISGGLIKIIKSFDKAPVQNIRTWLLAGIISFSQENILNSETIEEALSLIKMDVNYKKIINFFSPTQKDSEAKLLEQVLKNTEFNQTLGLPLMLLRKEDFEKNNSSPKELVFVLKALSNKIFCFSSFLVLWESPFFGLGIRGIFYSSNSKAIEKILKSFSGKTKGRAVLFELKERDLRKAKERIVEII